MIRNDNARWRDLVAVFLLLLATTLVWSFGRLTRVIPDVDPGRAAQMFVMSYGEEGLPISLVPNSIRRDQQRGMTDAGGFMVAGHSSQVIGVRALGLRPLADGEYPYTSSFGLQYRLAKPFYPLGPWPAYLALTLAVIAASCAMLAGMCRWAGRLAGRSAVIMLGVYFAAAPLFLDRIASPYWMLPLFLLPSLLAMLAWPRIRESRKGRVLFFAAMALAVLVKCLAGYEFIVPLVAAPAVFIMVDELRRAPERPWQALIRHWLPVALAMLAAGIAGFAGAVLLHILQGNALLPGRGLDVVMVPASYSVTGDGGGVRPRTGGMTELAIGLVKSFLLRNLHLNLAMGGALLFGGLRLARRHGSARAAWQALGANGKALAIALPFAILAMLSWHILAMNHALDHNHIVWFLVQIILAPVAIPLAAIIWREGSARN